MLQGQSIEPHMLNNQQKIGSPLPPSHILKRKDTHSDAVVKKLRIEKPLEVKCHNVPSKTSKDIYTTELKETLITELPTYQHHHYVAKKLSTHTLPFLSNIEPSKLFPKPKVVKEEDISIHSPSVPLLKDFDQPRQTRSQAKLVGAIEETSIGKAANDIPNTYDLRPVRGTSYKHDPFLADNISTRSKVTQETKRIDNKAKESTKVKEAKRKEEEKERRRTRENAKKLVSGRARIKADELVIEKLVLGEGQTSLVYKAKHKGLDVACKTGRLQSYEENEKKVLRELDFAAKLYTCRYVNKYFGWIYCHPSKLMKPEVLKKHTQYTTTSRPALFVVQRYFSNGDGRTYFRSRKSYIPSYEILRVAICLFSALLDAHNIGVGFVDLKLENLLIDTAGSAWITDFESCIEFKDNESVILTDEMSWTVGVAAPEMIDKSTFCKPSDVFMATVIIAELMATTTTDQTFEKKVLQRQENGKVDFITTSISNQYKLFFPLLEHGLNNNPSLRPTAKAALDFLLSMKAF